jgi:hypothetical protein
VTYPPPELQENKYTNFEYQYCVEIPPGWEARTKVPKDLAMMMGNEVTKRINLVLVNDEPGGLMIISNKRINRKYENFHKATREGILKHVHAYESSLKQAFDVSRFEYDIKPSIFYATQFKIDAGQNSFQPEAYLVIDVDMDLTIGGAKLREKHFIYPCQEDKSCEARITVSSNKDNYDGNHSAYEDFVSSFTVNIPIDQTE